MAALSTDVYLWDKSKLIPAMKRRIPIEWPAVSYGHSASSSTLSSLIKLQSTQVAIDSMLLRLKAICDNLQISFLLSDSLRLSIFDVCQTYGDSVFTITAYAFNSGEFLSMNDVTVALLFDRLDPDASTKEPLRFGICRELISRHSSSFDIEEYAEFYSLAHVARKWAIGKSWDDAILTTANNFVAPYVGGHLLFIDACRKIDVVPNGYQHGTEDIQVFCSSSLSVGRVRQSSAHIEISNFGNYKSVVLLDPFGQLVNIERIDAQHFDPWDLDHI